MVVAERKRILKVNFESKDQKKKSTKFFFNKFKNFDSKNP